MDIKIGVQNKESFLAVTNTWLKITKCEVCDKETDRGSPSPFLPCSYYKCDECRSALLVAYWELLCVLQGTNTTNSFDERLKELDNMLGTVKSPDYGSRRLLPTLKYFNKTKDEAWNEKHNWKNYQNKGKL